MRLRYIAVENGKLKMHLRYIAVENRKLKMHLRYIAVENSVRKGEIACYKQFILFLQCFLPYMALIFHFKCTLKCRLSLFQFGLV